MVTEWVDRPQVPLPVQAEDEQAKQPSREDHYTPAGIDKEKTNEQARSKTKDGDRIIVVHDHRKPDACVGTKHYLFVQGELVHEWIGTK